jgi:hypothetical protein
LPAHKSFFLWNFTIRRQKFSVNYYQIDREAENEEVYTCYRNSAADNIMRGQRQNLQEISFERKRLMTFGGLGQGPGEFIGTGFFG